MNMNYKIGIPIVIFIVISALFFYPILQGKQMPQSDISQYMGMAKEHTDFRKQTTEESYWTDAAFGGMPTYQLGAKYPYNFIKKIDLLLRFFPRPADYLFLCLFSFYVLLLVLKIDYRLAVLGALCYAFSTYFMILLEVGHNTKAHAIAYFPLVLSGLILVFRDKKIWGGLLFSLALAIDINSNHIQMTYYLMLLIGLYILIEAIKSFKAKDLKNFMIKTSVVVAGILMAVSLNSTSLLATKEYSNWTTRGTDDLTITPEGLPKQKQSGLDKDYITQYSYGIFESLDLFVPRLLGGSNHENIGKDSSIYDNPVLKKKIPKQYLDQIASGIPAYWGDQPIVAAPAYIGAITIFLLILSIFLLRHPLKKWLFCGVICSLLLSWGKNFGLLTDLMIDYFPLYNKFRAVSSIQVILELCAPILAILVLQQLLEKGEGPEKMTALKKTVYITGGLLLLLFIVQTNFDFSSDIDIRYQQYYGQEIIDVFRQDRQNAYNSDLLRTLLFVAMTAVLLWAYLKGKLHKNKLILVLGILILIDMLGVAKRYLDNDDFMSKRVVNKPFVATKQDLQIQQDKGFYRVWEPSVGFNGARTSYFHHSLGGYHAAKSKYIQNLYDYQISKSNREVFNMLNVKYFIVEDGVVKNDQANGNAWFVKKINIVENANQEIRQLDSLQTKVEAVMQSKFANQLPMNYELDSLNSITLTSYRLNELKYQSSNIHQGFAIFSNIYYPYGWEVYIDGVLDKIVKVDYALRGVLIPKGEHKVVFKFEPKTLKTGSYITLWASILFLILLLWAIIRQIKTKKLS